MPAIMTLQGPAGGVGSVVRTSHGPVGQCTDCGCPGMPACFNVPGARALAGFGDVGWSTITDHPWVLIGGLLIGGYLAAKGFAPFKYVGGKSASVWGGQRLAHSRTKALNGKRKR